MTDLEKNNLHDHAEHHHEHDRFAFYALVIFMIVLAIVAIQNFWQSGQSTTKTTSKQQATTETTIPLIEARTADAFPDLHDAMSIINTSQSVDKSDPFAEKLVNGIVEADEERVVYFATAKMFTSAQTDVSIYRMNTVSKRWQRIDKLSYAKEMANHYLRVIGRQGNQLLLFYDDTNRKDTACQSFWLLGTNSPYKLLTLNTTKPYEDLVPWNPPTGLIESETERLKTCGQNTK